MLIRITEQCHMGCSHCMVDAKPKGRHMTDSVFSDVLDFAGDLDGVVFLSGGEPTEHPAVLSYIRQAYTHPRIKFVLLLSNGSFLSDPGQRDRILAIGILVQVTNDPRYYPKRVEQYEHALVVYERQLSTLVALGRSSRAVGRKSPQCFNLRSCVREFGSLQQAVVMLRSALSFCTPSIDVDGVIRAGESNQCFNIGNIYDDPEVLVQNLLTHDCDKCEGHQLLSPSSRVQLSRGTA